MKYSQVHGLIMSICMLSSFAQFSLAFPNATYDCQNRNLSGSFIVEYIIDPDRNNDVNERIRRYLYEIFERQGFEEITSARSGGVLFWLVRMKDPQLQQFHRLYPKVCRSMYSNLPVVLR